jgi:hypothetical protein
VYQQVIAIHYERVSAMNRQVDFACFVSPHHPWKLGSVKMGAWFKFRQISLTPGLLLSGV